MQVSGHVRGGAAVSPGPVKGVLCGPFCVRRACQSQRGLPWLVELVGCPGRWGGEAALSSPAGQHGDPRPTSLWAFMSFLFSLCRHDWLHYQPLVTELNPSLALSPTQGLAGGAEQSSPVVMWLLPSHLVHPEALRSPQPLVILLIHKRHSSLQRSQGMF